MAVAALDQQAVGLLIDKLIDAYNRRDVEGVLACCTDDVYWEDPTSGAIRGKNMIRAALRTVFTAFPDLHFPKEELNYYMSFDGTRGASSWRLTSTMTGPMNPPGYAPTGRQVDIKGACLYEFRDGLISHHTIVFDMVDLGRQIGAIPAAGSLMDKLSVRLQRMKVSRRR